MLFGAAAGVDGFESDVRSVFNFGDDYIPPTAHQIASSKVREDLEDVGVKLPDWLGGASVGQVAYDAITTAANAAPSLLVSYATGIPMAGNVLSGINTAGNAYNQALNEGFAKDQARDYGILVGTSEVVLNKLLGGISAYGGNKLGNKALQNLTNVGKTLKMVAKTLGGGLSEIPEGHLQAALETMLRNIVLKTDEKVDFLSPEMLYSDLLSALTGIGVESVDAVVKGLSAESTTMDSSTKDSDYAEFADILNEPEDLENFKYLASLPKAEQEAFISSLTVDALEEGKPATALEDAEFADILSEPEDLENFKHMASLPKAEQEAFIDSLFEEDSLDALEENSLATVEEIVNPEAEISRTEDLPVEESTERGILKLKNSELANGLPIKGTANSTVDKTDDNGKTLQRRIYGDDGMAIIDLDTSDHGLPKAHPNGAHKHIFDYSKKKPRGNPQAFTAEELEKYKDVIRKGENYHDESGID